MNFLPVLCVFLAFALSANALDREAFTFTRYDLSARIEPEQQRLGVRGKIVLRNDSKDAQKVLVLQISSTLSWRSVQIDGRPAEFLSQPYTSDVDHTGALSEAVVTLPKAIAPGATIEVQVGYEGIIPQDATRLTRIGVPEATAKHSDWDQIGRPFTAVRGIGYVAWYPIATEAANLSNPGDVAETVGRWKKREAGAEMKVRFQLSQVAPNSRLFCDGATGTVKEPTPETQCTYQQFGSFVPVFAVGNYEGLDHTGVSIFYSPEHKSGAEDYALAFAEISSFVTDAFGDHHSGESKALVAELPDTAAAPFWSGNLLLIPLTADDTTLLLSAIQQAVQMQCPSPRSWIFEGLPRYAQVAYLLQKKDRPAAIAFLDAHRAALTDSAKQDAPRPSDWPAQHSLINATDEFYVQAKAMNVWWMLRDMVGETALNAALHNYQANDDKDVSYMQKLIEAQAHRDLEWFFDDWVYRDRGQPDFRIASVYPRELVGGGYMVTVSVENLGEAAAEVPVTLRMAVGEGSGRVVVPGKSKASVRIQTQATPYEAIVNDGSVPETDFTNNTFKVTATAETR